MKNKENSVGSSIITLLLVISIAMNVFLLGCKSTPPTPQPQPKNLEETRAIQTLANYCGVNNVSNKSSMALLSDIKIKLEKEKFNGEPLSNSEREKLEKMLSKYFPELWKKIQKNDSIIKNMQGKSYVILPE